MELDPTSSGETFKYQLYSLTGVEPDRQKILIKGGQLKDETDLSTLGVKPGQTFMMMGTSSSGSNPVLERPAHETKFMEDMTEAEAAKVDGATPAGLQNLGNTCYLNSTLQTLRSVPELQEQLFKYKATPSENPLLGRRVDITGPLKDLYSQMADTQEGFPPFAFLHALRTAFPQFAQRSKSGQGYAQQDAEEAWTQIMSQLRLKLKIKNSTPIVAANSNRSDSEISFIDRYFSGRFESVMECDESGAEAAGEKPILGNDFFLKLDCHINKDISHLHDGILAGLEEKLEKKSPTLDRDAIYTKKSRIARLPKYLVVHFVRFYWKREAQKKAKIMRKVTFPAEMDITEFCTQRLKEQLLPVRDKVREIRKDEEDVLRARKRQKLAHKQEEDRASDSKNHPPKKEQNPKDGNKSEGKTASTEIPDAVYKTDAEHDAERATSILAAKKELHALINPQLANDEGSNRSGLYELRGMITHQGASADSGHYTSYIKKQGIMDPATGKRKEEDGKWWWFNDDKVSEVEAEKIETLSGGGMLNFSSYFKYLDDQDRVLANIFLRREPFCVGSAVPCYRFTDIRRYHGVND